jgi:hypothetical protein
VCGSGFGEDRDAFTSRMHLGPHLLAPTGSDLARYNKPGTVFAGWHSDLNFLTIHGKSNFPGLSVWTREGKKMGVKVPDGCLLVQAGKQIEYLTGAGSAPQFQVFSVVLKQSCGCKTVAVRTTFLLCASSPCAVQSDQRLTLGLPTTHRRICAGWLPRSC